MTVSMLTTRLSDVITGCGGNDTTCSRRSTVARGRSTNGMRKCRPGSSVREYRPSRSTITELACDTTRTARMIVITTNRTNRSTTIRPMALPLIAAPPVPWWSSRHPSLGLAGPIRWDRAGDAGAGRERRDHGGRGVDADALHGRTDFERVPVPAGAERDGPGRPDLAGELDAAATVGA